MQKKDYKIFEFLSGRTMHDLILFCLSKIIEDKEKTTVERIVAECFNVFPKSFELKGYSKWPDSRKLDKSLRGLRKQKLIKGDPKTSFTLTKQGEKIVEDMLKDLRQKKLL
ncbi:MAG: hypothetical protein HQ539_00990 [Parcubacteria group bacterium]|nr:hypothetical protein [Parcubacteria group bacterium]